MNADVRGWVTCMELYGLIGLCYSQEEISPNPSRPFQTIGSFGFSSVLFIVLQRDLVKIDLFWHTSTGSSAI